MLLQSLTLRQCPEVSSGILAKVLCHMPQLRLLDVSKNWSLPPQAHNLLRALGTFGSLQELDLRGMPLGVKEVSGGGCYN